MGPPPAELFTVRITLLPDNGMPGTTPFRTTGAPTAPVVAAGRLTCCRPKVVRIVTVGVWPGSSPVIVAFTVVVFGPDVRVVTRAAIAPTGPSTAAAAGPQGTWSATLAGSWAAAGSFGLHAACAVLASFVSLGRTVAALAESLLADANSPIASRP